MSDETRHAEVHADAIRVDIRDGGTVHIDGRVDNWSELQAVKRTIWSAPGVRSIEDRLTVG